eukprot:g32247.t1
MPIVDREQKGVYEVRSADEISVFLDSKVHETGGEGMVTMDEYKRSLEAKRSKGDQAARRPDSGKGTASSSDWRGRREEEHAHLTLACVDMLPRQF